jgi:hypothetical protein
MGRRYTYVIEETTNRIVLRAGGPVVAQEGQILAYSHEVYRPGFHFYDPATDRILAPSRSMLAVKKRAALERKEKRREGEQDS